MATVNIKVGNNWENIALSTYPVGSVYISYVNISPATLFGGTWSQITTGVLRMANDTNTGGSDTFTIASKNLPTHTHSVGAHSHGLNSHKHSVGAHSHGLNSHTHTYAKVNSPTGGTSITKANLPTGITGEANFRPVDGGNRLYHSAGGVFSTENWNDSSAHDYVNLVNGAKVINKLKFDLGGSGTAHSHTTSTTSTNTGQASGSTANSTAFDSGAASGSTANSTAFESGNGGFANEAISNLPAYQNLYAWRRTA